MIMEVIAKRVLSPILNRILEWSHEKAAFYEKAMLPLSQLYLVSPRPAS